MKKKIVSGIMLSLFLLTSILGTALIKPAVAEEELINFVYILSVTASPSEVYVGEVVHITVVWEILLFDFTGVSIAVYYDDTMISERSMILVGYGYIEETWIFTWDTTDVLPGIYRISAHAYYGTTYIDGYVTVESGPPPPPITATVDINPDTLNLWSLGEWITSYIELPEGYNVSDIDISTVMLDDTVPVSLLDVPTLEPVPTEIGDYDNDGIPDLMVKFNRTEVASWICNDLGIQYGNVTLTITGELSDGTLFEGSDIIMVRMPGDVDCNGRVNIRDVVLVAIRYGEANPEPYYDLNEDGEIDILDIVIVATNYGKTYT